MTDNLTASLGRYPHVEKLFLAPFELSGDVVVTAQEGGTLESIGGMLSNLEFDICELPIINYLSAKELGLAATAIPVFVTRRFPHNMLVVNTSLGIDQPRDLEGKRFGITYHGNTDAAWLRGLLQETYDVDLSSITWVAARAEQIPEAQLPDNVELDLTDPAVLLESGALAAQCRGRGPGTLSAHIKMMWPDAETMDESWFASTGIFPILHTIVIKDAVLAAHPSLASDLFAAFSGSKSEALSRVESGVPLNAEQLISAGVSGFPTAPMATRPRAYLGADPIPYGLEVNRTNLEMIVRFAAAQQIIYALPKLEELFVNVA